MRLTRFILCVPVLLTLCGPAYAQIFLEEGKVKVDVVPGENVAGKLTLHNTSDQDVDVKVYWEDFVYTPPFDGSKEFLPKGTTDFSVAGWANVPSRTLMFGPYAKRTVSYSINVPEDIRQGHYGVLFFEKEAGAIEGKTGLNVVTRVGCLFFIEPKNKTKKAKIQNFRFAGKALTADFTNAGNVILIPDGTFYVINQEGMVFDRGQMQKVYLPPGKTAEYPLMLNRDLDPGTYTLVMTVDLNEGDVLVKEIDFKKDYSSGLNIIEIRD